jgi:hypothetical protein
VTTRLREAVARGRLDGLRALRDVLTADIESGPGDKASQTAALARQLREVLREIDTIEQSRPKDSVVDELTSRRASRRATSAGTP